VMDGDAKHAARWPTLKYTTDDSVVMPARIQGRI
jgi:hypothetical protein